MSSKNEKEYIAARAVEVMTITKIIKQEVRGQIDSQPVSDAVKKWTLAIVDNVCKAYDGQLGTGVLAADEELAKLAGKIVSEELKKAKEK